MIEEQGYEMAQVVLRQLDVAGPLTVVTNVHEPTETVRTVTDTWQDCGAVDTVRWRGALLTSWPESMSKVTILDILEGTAVPGWVLFDISVRHERNVHVVLMELYAGIRNRLRLPRKPGRTQCRPSIEHATRVRNVRDPLDP